MARTTFNGPVASDNGFIFPTATAAVLGDATDAVNTVNKVTGKSVVDIATGVIYTATGSSATSAWKGSNATTVTPS
jgi:predicted methyltransferase